MLAWMRELTPDGVKKTDPAGEGEADEDEKFADDMPAPFELPNVLTAAVVGNLLRRRSGLRD